MTKFYFKRIIIGIILFYALFLVFITKPPVNAIEEPVEQQTEEQTEEFKKEANDSSQQVEESIEEREEQEREKAEEEAKKETYTYQTVNMYPEHYEGGDDDIYNKCTYEYNCVFVAPDDPNFDQFDTILIDGVEYTVMEKTSNCNQYYNSLGTYSRGTSCVEFWDNETYNKKEIKIKGD